MGSRRSVAGFEPGTSGLTGLHINHNAIEKGYMIHLKVLNLMPLQCMTSTGKRSSQFNRLKKRLEVIG